MSGIGREYALEEEAFYVPLKGILPRVVQAFGVTPDTAGEVVQNGMLAGTIAWREVRLPGRVSNSIVANPRTAQLIGVDRLRSHIDWRNGKWIDPERDLEVYWPDVRQAIGVSEQVQTIEGQLAPAALTQLKGPGARGAGGRPRKYDWTGLEAALAAKLYEDGCPALGEQAELERWAASWFPPDCQPSESQVRERVSKAIRVRRATDDKA